MQTYFIKIQENPFPVGYTLRRFKGKLIKYLERNKVVAPTIDDLSSSYSLRNGLHVAVYRHMLSRDGVRTLDILVTGEDGIVEKSVEALRSVYSGPIVVQYLIPV